MVRFSITVFLSAFLSFQVQPLIGKFILPWFGGMPAVWTTCLLFFQSFLLLGYAYAHGSVQFLSQRQQTLIHGVLLCASLALLPITPSVAWRPIEGTEPTLRILSLLVVTVGGPYLILTATAPLLQSWYRVAQPGKSPYRLYSLSNAGSLLGLFAYPFLIERIWPLPTQTQIWSLLYGLFVLASCISAWVVFRIGDAPYGTDCIPRTSGHVPADGTKPVRSSPSSAVSPLRWSDVGFWLSLSATGSVMLMATTNRICQDVASVPFLWVVPLGLYLLSFIVLFAHQGWYHRKVFALAMMLAVMLVVPLSVWALSMNITLQVAAYCFILTTSCFVCHGELVHSKPAPEHLTAFYVAIAAGGALGGVFVTLVAPRIFAGYYEFNVGLVATMALFLLAGRREHWRSLAPGARRRNQLATLGVAAAIGGVMLVGIGVITWWSRPLHTETLVHRRNFYGSSEVARLGIGDSRFSRIVMTHGNTIHGVQFEAISERRTPTMYYTRDSGVGFAIERHPKRLAGRPLKLGVIGLGAGTISCYAGHKDTIRFYEIDPLVMRLAEEYFSFQKDARLLGADVTVQLGDARIVLERQLLDGHDQQFDVLVVDAFTSDSIPLHLLTRECFELYWRHLQRDGILAAHITNRHLDLRPVIKQAAVHAGRDVIWISLPADRQLLDAGKEFGTGSEWVLVTNNSEFLHDNRVQAVGRPLEHLPPIELTDNFSSLFQLLR